MNICQCFIYWKRKHVSIRMKSHKYVLSTNKKKKKILFFFCIHIFQLRIERKSHMLDEKVYKDRKFSLEQEENEKANVSFCIFWNQY